MQHLSHPIDTNLLRTFAVVAETRHFTRAAERLNCVQSAVSMQIKRLEDTLQVRLLERSRRDVKLTAEGEIILRYAYRMMRLTDETLAEIGHPAKSGRVRLGATDLSMCYLPKVLQQFALRYPMIDVDLRCERSWEALESLEAGEVDIAFVTQRCGHNGGKLLGQSPLVWVAAKHADLTDLDPVPLALFGPGCIYRKAAIDALERQNKSYRLAYESPSRAGLDCVVGAGLAITTVPTDYVGDDMRVIPASADGLPPLPNLKTYLFGTSAKHTPAIKAFCELLVDILNRDSAYSQRR